MAKSLLAALAAALLSATSVSADMIKKSSPHPVAATVDRLAAAVEKAGAKVFARIDHAGGAAKVGQELRPTQMLMFGNPKLGTPAIQGAQTMGLDLPLRVVVWEDEEGKTWLAYHDPADIAALHDLPTDAPVIAKMQGALGKLTSLAVAQ